MSEASKPARWTVTLNGNEWGTAKYGIVEYLRPRPKLRALTAVIGLLWVVGWFLSAAGFKWHIAALPLISTFFVTPHLLWFAVVSGPDFSLAFAQTKTPEPSGTAATEAKGVLDAEGFGVEALNKSYVSAEAYGRSSFRWAIFSLIGGAAVVSANDWLIWKGGGNANLNHLSQLNWTLSGTLFLLCVMFLIRAMLAFRRAALIHERLLDLQKIVTAVNYLERAQKVSPANDQSVLIAKLLAPCSSIDID